MNASDLYIKDPFAINQFACISAGRILETYEPADESAKWSNWSPENKFTFKLVFISICHDINWDYLQEKLANFFSEDMDRLSAAFLAKFSAPVLKNLLIDYHKQERVRAEERAALLRDIGKGLIEKYNGIAYNIVLQSNNMFFGETGLHTLLNQFKAYKEDPLRKKANILTHELVKERILNFRDSDKIQPAIEYHILRLYERTGRVVARSEELRDALRNRKPLTDWFVSKLRGIVSEALIYTAISARKEIADINYVEWQIARHICLTNEPRCVGHKSSPNDLPEDISKIFEGSCPYLSFCAAHSDKTFIKLNEPIPKRTKSYY